jgi:uncharacterized protein (TIGR02246 family)
MNSLGRVLAIVTIVFPAASQTVLVGTIEPDPAGGYKLRATFRGQVRSLAPEVLGAPYSGEQVRREIQTTADGGKITRDFPSVWMFRDSQGRRRIEHSILTGPNGEPGLVIVEIRDFVGGYEYTLDQLNRIAHRMRLPADVTQSKVRNTAVAPTDLPMPHVSIAYSKDRERTATQSLGTRTIEGSVSDGTMVITGIPAGKLGNNQMITQRTTTWVAQDLKVIVLSTKSDGISTQTETKLVSIKRKEPDPALFRIPDDYKVVDEEDNFTIEIHRAKETPAASPEDEQAVRKVLTDFADARNAYNASAMKEIYADTAIYAYQGGAAYTGRTEIGGMWEKAVATKEGKAIRTIKTIRFPRPDVALVVTDVHYEGVKGATDFQEEYQLGKNTGRWQIRYHKNLVAGESPSK